MTGVQESALSQNNGLLLIAMIWFWVNAFGRHILDAKLIQSIMGNFPCSGCKFCIQETTSSIERLPIVKVCGSPFFDTITVYLFEMDPPDRELRACGKRLLALESLVNPKSASDENMELSRTIQTFRNFKDISYMGWGARRLNYNFRSESTQNIGDWPGQCIYRIGLSNPTIR